MSQNIPEPVPHRPDPQPNGAVRPWLKFTSIVFLLLCAGVFALFFRKEHPPKASPEHQAAVQANAEVAQPQPPAHVSAESAGVAANPTAPPPRPTAVPSTPLAP